MKVCTDCGHEFGSFRTRCPACGGAPRARSINNVHKFTPACVACEKPNAKTLCPLCNLYVHAHCLELHAKYQHRKPLTQREVVDVITQS